MIVLFITSLSKKMAFFSKKNLLFSEIQDSTSQSTTIFENCQMHCDSEDVFFLIRLKSGENLPVDSKLY